MTTEVRRLGLAIVVVAVWAAITLVVPTLLLDSKTSLQELITKNLAWGVAGAAAFLVMAVWLAVWRDMGLRAPRRRAGGSCCGFRRSIWPGLACSA